MKLPSRDCRPPGIYVSIHVARRHVVDRCGGRRPGGAVRERPRGHRLHHLVDHLHGTGGLPVPGHLQPRVVTPVEPKDVGAPVGVVLLHVVEREPEALAERENSLMTGVDQLTAPLRPLAGAPEACIRPGAATDTWFASYTVTFVNPASLSVIAADMPEIPAPTTAIRGCAGGFEAPQAVRGLSTTDPSADAPAPQARRARAPRDGSTPHPTPPPPRPDRAPRQRPHPCGSPRRRSRPSAAVCGTSPCAPSRPPLESHSDNPAAFQAHCTDSRHEVTPHSPPRVDRSLPGTRRRRRRSARGRSARPSLPRLRRWRTA